MSRTVRFVALVVSLITVALVVGFMAAVGALALLEAVLPPFKPEDDDTMRQFVPVAVAYLVWGLGTTVTLVLGWRRIRRYRP